MIPIRSRHRLPVLGCTVLGVIGIGYIAYRYCKQRHHADSHRKEEYALGYDHEFYACLQEDDEDESLYTDEEEQVDVDGDPDKEGDNSTSESDHNESDDSTNDQPIADLTSGTVPRKSSAGDNNIEDMVLGQSLHRGYILNGRHIKTKENKVGAAVDSHQVSCNGICMSSEDEEYDSDADMNVDAALPLNIGHTLGVQSIIPGKQKVYFKGFGCAHNISDSEYMRGLLSEYGYNLTNTLQEAHIAVINSCTVKGPSQDAMTSEILQAHKLGIPVVVGGCVSQADANVSSLQNVSIVGLSQIDRIVEVVEETLLGRRVVMLERKDLPKLNLPKIRQNALVEIIPLSTGCLGSCTFCKTKQARGVLGSYAMEAILDRVEAVIQEGVKQIWLTSEDTGAYGLDIGTDIVALLKAIVALLPNDVMLRLGMSNPPYILKHAQDIAKILKHDNVFEFLHIPVQSGSNAVLDAMNREYTIEEFTNLVNSIREGVPTCTFATDIICGFPTETDADHLDTVELLNRFKFPIVNISQFYPRPGTIAAKMKQQKNKVSKSRTRHVTQIFNSYECNSRYIGTTIPVWFSQVDENRGHTVGHSKNYIKVIVDLDYNLLGTKRFVAITATSKWHLQGKIT